MASFSHYPLQKALYNALTADSTLMATVTGVFDKPPQGQEYPYVTIGEASARDWSTKTSQGCEYNAAFYIWSREGGRRECELIMERIHTLLHDGNLSIEGQSLVLMRYISSDVQVEGDGLSYRASMRFTIMLQAV